MPVAPPAARTKSERVYESLRADIHTGRLPPGTRLRYAELCGRYEVSAGVLREALLRLREQGLVNGEPNFGFQVIELSVEDLKDLTASRVVLEALALRDAITEGGVDWESRILAAHHRLARTEQRDPEDPLRLSDDWVIEHAAFHRALIEGCRNRRLKELANSLRDAAEIYRRWSLPLGNIASERDVAAEHEALQAAVIGRDADLAVELLTVHISTTTNLLLRGFLEDASDDRTEFVTPSSSPCDVPAR
jgi:DNA-binding GntR family transcriptional regulator